MKHLPSTYIIAEAGVNHNGSLELAKKLVDAAAEAGANAVKFQTFKADALVSKEAPKADYQKVITDMPETQYEMLKKFELDETMHCALIEYCQEKGIQFLSTPFDSGSLDLLINRFNLPLIKIPSGEITNAPFLLEIAQMGKPIILSTGMSTLGEVETALGVLAFGYLNNKKKACLQSFKQAYFKSRGQELLREKVTLLHCTTEYPTPYEEVNLKAIDTLKTAFGLRVGFSDHTEGIAVSIAAVARGSTVIEKHFTVDKKLPGPDHKASLEPEELKLLVKSIRQIERTLGSGMKIPTESEWKNILVARKSLVAAEKICVEEHFSKTNLAIKRPGDGISPLYYWDWLGKKATKNYDKDEKVLE